MKTEVYKREDFLISCDNMNDEFSHYKQWIVVEEQEIINDEKKFILAYKIVKFANHAVLFGLSFILSNIFVNFNRSFSLIDFIVMMIFCVLMVVILTWTDEEFGQWRNIK